MKPNNLPIFLIIIHNFLFYFNQNFIEFCYKHPNLKFIN